MRRRRGPPRVVRILESGHEAHRGFERDDRVREAHRDAVNTALSELERWCRRGPSLAEVTSVTVEKLPTLRGFVDFDIA